MSVFVDERNKHFILSMKRGGSYRQSVSRVSAHATFLPADWQSLVSASGNYAREYSITFSDEINLSRFPVSVHINVH